MNSPEANAVVLASVIAAIVSLLTVIASMYTVVITNRLGAAAKEREIKLQNYHKDKIEAVKTLYSLIVEIQFAGNKLTNFRNKDCSHTTYKLTVTSWLSAYKNVYIYYNKNRILLLENSVLSAQIQSSLNKLSPILKAVSKEYSSLDQLEEHYGGQLAHYYYDSEVDEIDEIGKRLDKLMDDVNTYDMTNSFNKIRDDLEAYFRQLIN